MTMHELDTVVLVCDLTDHGLKKGDMGAVVQAYPSGAVEVEFVTAAGVTQALVMLDASQVRAPASSDMPSVRPVDAA